MPLGTFGGFVYALILVGLYLSPIAVLVLFFAYRNHKFKQGLVAVLVAWPLLSLIGVGLFQLDLASEATRRDEQITRLQSLFSLQQPRSEFYGERVEGYRDVNGFLHARYRFQFDHGTLTLDLPPGNITSVASMDITDQTVVGQGAQLWLLGANQHRFPRDTDASDYFKDEFNVEQPEDEVIFMSLYPGRNSRVVYWYEDETGQGRWASQMLVLAFLEGGGDKK